ncbi:MAG TPA: hypothetical protein VE969_06745 [Pyrinomonadaceae bacterium]|jgi:hypothetical protein|nr:hypothetical protein [Pyrinomonadaceae bacterium]
MTLKALKLMLAIVVLTTGFTTTTRPVRSAPALPNPVLYLTGTELFQQNGKSFVKYHYDVFNKEAYPADMFAAAPDLPPCGKNTKSSRTWVDIFDQSGKRIYGFCALAKPTDLNGLWFSLEEGTTPPSWIYIEMNDRKTNTKYKSNLAETSQ